MPFPNASRDNRGRLEPQFRQRLDRVGIILDAGEDETAADIVETRGILEERGVMIHHMAQMPGENGGKARRRGEAAEARKLFQGRRIGGQTMRLLVVDHLQAMLDAAQEIVGAGQLRLDAGADPAVAPQLTQHRQRARAAQIRPLAAKDQLLRLHEELDLADAAAAELHIGGRQPRSRRRPSPHGSAASSRGCRRWPRSRNTCARRTAPGRR